MQIPGLHPERLSWFWGEAQEAVILEGFWYPTRDGLLVSGSACEDLGSRPSDQKTSKKLNRLKKSITLLGQIRDWTTQDKSPLPRRERLRGECREMWLSGAETREQKLPWEPVLGLESRNYN